tara:strand:+ start:294 stop:683 length:390 start_codon:yes stop_codon:yes gene_type:complete
MIKNKTGGRPLSPHLTIYRPQFTSVLSIFHRITGVALAGTLILLVIWFFSLAVGENLFKIVNLIFLSWPVKLLFGLSVWAIWYHSCTGVRHLLYDCGVGLDSSWINRSAYIVLVLSLLLTILTFIIRWV